MIAGFQARIQAFLQVLQRIGLERWPQSADRVLDGPRPIPPRLEDTQRNWSRSRPTLFWPMALRPSAPMLQATRTIPVVFPAVSDPVGAGFVESLARPGGNATGFMTYEYSIGAKWLELLKEIAPRITRAAVIRDPTDGAGLALYGAI